MVENLLIVANPLQEQLDVLLGEELGILLHDLPGCGISQIDVRESCEGYL